MPSEEYRAASSMQEFVERELTSCKRAYDAGVLPVLYDALEICQENDHPVPPWMVEAMRRVMVMLFSGGAPQRRGRTGNPFAKYKADLIHYARWDAVKEVREYQVKHRERLKKLSAPEVTEEERRRVAANRVDPGRTWEDAYKRAPDWFAGTHVFCSPATMKNSYRKVERALKDPSQAPRFKLLSRRTRGLLESKIDADPIPPKPNRVKK